MKALPGNFSKWHCLVFATLHCHNFQTVGSILIFFLRYFDEKSSLITILQNSRKYPCDSFREVGSQLLIFSPSQLMCSTAKERIYCNWRPDLLQRQTGYIAIGDWVLHSDIPDLLKLTTGSFTATDRIYRNWRPDLLRLTTGSFAATGWICCSRRPYPSHEQAGSIASDDRILHSDMPDLSQLVTGSIAIDDRILHSDRPDLLQLTTGSIAIDDRIDCNWRPDRLQLTTGSIAIDDRILRSDRPDLLQLADMRRQERRIGGDANSNSPRVSWFATYLAITVLESVFICYVQKRKEKQQ